MQFLARIILPLTFLAATAFGADTGLASESNIAGAPSVAKSSVSSKDTNAIRSGSGDSSSREGSSSNSTSQPKHAKLLKDAKSVPGLIPFYQKGNKLYAELNSSHYNSEFIVVIAIARGIGQDPLYGGMTWSMGDDWVWKFRKVDDRVHVIRKNVRFKAKPGSPEATAMKYAYTDSVLFSLPATTKGPKGGDLVDMTSIFMSDLPQISRYLRGFSFSSTKSSWADVKGYSDNCELEVAATYSSSGSSTIETVADTRGVTINVHYSISKLKSTGYKPRMADDRVGYFLTVLKDYSKNGKQDRFLRYINRWNLEPADPTVELSPPKKPIIFWLETTVPFKYRNIVRSGILEWNKAFEKAGYVDAIEVRQQPDNADWDSEDINYNTFRWITSSAGFAMGPSRVNPRTGEILDADIIFDADFLQYWKREYETLTPQTISRMTGGAIDIHSYRKEQAQIPFGHLALTRSCNRQQSMSTQFALGQSVIAAAGATNAAWQKDLERLQMQGLKATVMHEIGHTLGLRHNFKSSTMLPLRDLHDSSQTSQTGLMSSVMDYDAVNLAAKDQEQGDFYTTTIGPYDYWAIEYGYKPLKGGTAGEVKELAKIAARSGD
ncbi:MAG: zinc-dependent metalloprotease, partial [Planctomycetota bacterium]